LYTIHVHALKSAAANIGAEELANTAKDLEMAGKRTDLAFIEAHHSQVLAALESLLSGIHSGLSAYRRNAGVTGDFPDMEVLKARLVRLKLALETMDARAMNSTMDVLLSLKLTEDAGAAVQNISRSILMAEYDEALTSTTLLAESLLRDLKNE
jgi:HPt (histidine-containing phosphotransfer) domain-containing protein